MLVITNKEEGRSDVPMSFDQAMIHFSAPTICGIKPANLFSVRKECFSTHEFIRRKKTLAEQGVAVKLVKSSNRIFLVLVYNTLWIERLLEDASVRSYLGGKGYKDCPDVAKTVGRIAWRMKNPSCFLTRWGYFWGTRFWMCRNSRGIKGAAAITVDAGNPILM